LTKEPLSPNFKLQG